MNADEFLAGWAAWFVFGSMPTEGQRKFLLDSRPWFLRGYAVAAMVAPGGTFKMKGPFDLKDGINVFEFLLDRGDGWLQFLDVYHHRMGHEIDGDLFRLITKK